MKPDMWYVDGRYQICHLSYDTTTCYAINSNTNKQSYDHMMDLDLGLVLKSAKVAGFIPPNRYGGTNLGKPKSRSKSKTHVDYDVTTWWW